jgi:hypothetical protein
MLKRAWLLFSTVWSVFVLWLGSIDSTSEPRAIAFWAVFPWLTGIAIWWGLRFIFTGIVKEPRIRVYRN